MATSRGMKWGAGTLTIAAINLIVLLVLFEVASLGFYYLQTGHLFYVRNQRRGAKSVNPFATQFQSNTNEISLIYQFHPYFGFVYRDGYVERGHASETFPYALDYPANNCGFLSRYDFPFKKTNKDQFIIGIFGGSVATVFSLYEFENHTLVKALKRIPDFQDKELVVLNFAAGGYKQPQQLLVLNYFLSIGQELDMVINIDGVNETDYWNNRFSVDISMPMVHVALPLSNLANKDFAPDELILSLEILNIKKQLRGFPVQLDNCGFATCYALRWFHAKYLFKQYQRKMQAFTTLKRTGTGRDSLIHLNGMVKPLDDMELYEQMAKLWANASLAMKNVSSARNILFYHFIQPNQYYPTKRQFSEEEKRIAFSKGNFRQENTAKGYPKLFSKMNALQKSGVRIFNAVDAFDEIPGVVYIDNSCHYNKLGNEVFASYIAKAIAESGAESQP